uniref:Potassium-transporting ATPase A chain n=1 Tax=Anthurium amnicola TaxID=1678845 RepID=A0A1D1YPF9_9ARAE
MSQENTTVASANEGKIISFNVPEGSNSGTKDIKSTTESSGFDRSNSNELALTSYETQSIDENVEPWKQAGPWYKNATKRKWFAYGIIVTLIVVIIIVIPVSVANALKNKQK